MSPSRTSIPKSFKMVVGLLALLTVFAVLQYHWLGEVSRAEQERMRASLRSAVNRFAEDFDREIARAFVYFLIRPTPSGAAEEEQIVERFRLWSEEAPYPELLGNVFLARPREEGGLQWSRLDPATAQLEPMDGARASRLQSSLRGSISRRQRGRESMPLFVIEEIPALAIPIPLGPNSLGPERPRLGNRQGRPRRLAERRTGALLVLQLDSSFMRKELLPALAARYFARGGELDFELVVYRVADPDTVIFQSDPSSVFLSGDAGTRLFGSIPFGELRHLWVETGLGREGFPRMPGGPAPPPPASPSATFGDGARNETGLWRLVVRHRAGSLEAAVSAARIRNLAISLGVLGLLAVSMVLILFSTRRAQQLARQQMEFVAGVSHELKTPLAVIRSAGQNLADGVIDGSAQLKEYGTLIEKEGRRLSDMVDQVLEFAGLQSAARPPEKVAVTIEDIIETALADCEPAISEAEIHVEKKIESDLPLFMADASALRRALRNLIDNAVKYGAQGKWIGVGARRTKHGLIVTVEDRGPGIAPVDLPHVFEPFYRGRHTPSGLAQDTRGNGLGLSLVRQIVQGHGGRVRVRSSIAGGTVFTIQLPIEPAESVT